jgi:hypothetical protein
MELAQNEIGQDQNEQGNQQDSQGPEGAQIIDSGELKAMQMLF